MRGSRRIVWLAVRVAAVDCLLLTLARAAWLGLLVAGLMPA